jgi:hypothetical protein
MAKKKIEAEEEDDEGPEFIEEDLDDLKDDMLADETDVKSREDDEIVKMLREIDCAFCDGNSTKDKCKVRDAHGCPPDKVDK